MSQRYGDQYGPPSGTTGGGDPHGGVGGFGAETFYPSMYAPMPTTTNAMLHAVDDPAKREHDKEAIYSHPLYPLLVVLFEKCELATSTPRDASREGAVNDVCSSASFKEDLNDFIKQRQSDPVNYVPNRELDTVMLQSIQMLRFHLLELEKVHELCDNFCNRYVTCLKGKMPMDIVQEERASSSQPPMSPSTNTVHSNSPPIHTPMSFGHFQQPYEPQAMQHHPDANLGHPMEGTSMGYGGHPAAAAGAATGVGGGPGTHPQHPHSGHQDHPLAMGGAPATAGAPQTLPLAAVSSPSASSSAGGLRHNSTPLSGDTPNNQHNNDSVSDAGDDYSLGDSTEDGGRESVLSDGQNGASNGKRKVPKVFSKEAITKFRTWLFSNLQHPYPSEEQKKQLANDTGLTILQVNNWFINARRRIVQPMIDQSNRNGRPAQVNVFKNRRRNRSDASPGGPSPDLGSTYSPDPASVVASAAAASMAVAQAPYGAAGDLYARSMFPTAGYGMLPNPMGSFMTPMMGFPSGQPLNPWMDPLLGTAPPPHWPDNVENGADKDAQAKPLF